MPAEASKPSEPRVEEPKKPKVDRKPEGGMIRRLDPQELIQTALESNAGVETLERLFDLYKDIRAYEAKEKWNQAMAQFQKDCPKILKTEAADFPTKTGGKIKYTYAPLEEILGKIQPVMAPLGLSVSWRNRIEKDQVVANCRISHEAGHHEESGEVAMPIITGDIGASGPQRVGIAMTYALRYSLRSIIGISPEDDPDANLAEGGAQEPRPMPRRASESKNGSEIPNPWVGKVKSVEVLKSGTSDGKGWKLFLIRGVDGQDFKTFSESDAGFAQEAGASSVAIEWEADPKGGRRIVMIEPVEARDPGK